MDYNSAVNVKAHQQQLVDTLHLHLTTPTSSDDIKSQAADLSRQINSCNFQQLCNDNYPSWSLLLLLKLVARKHGLHKSIFSDFVAEISSNNSPPPSFHLIQILRYSMDKDHSILNYEQCWLLINCHVNGYRDDNIDESSTSQAILSELVQCLAMKLNLDSPAAEDIPDSLEQLEEKLVKVLPFLNDQTKSEIMRKLEIFKAWKIRKKDDSSTTTTQNIDEYFVSDNLKVPTSDNFVYFGEEIFRKIETDKTQKHQNDGPRAAPRADAVKTQQVIASYYRQNVSEKSQVESIHLANALDTGRSMNSTKIAAKQINPGEQSAGGSDCSWYQTTDSSINLLWQKADAGKLIKTDDIEYLLQKTDSGFIVSNAMMSISQYSRICDIFSKIVKYQALNGAVISRLANNFFSQNENEYENARLFLLHAFETYAEKQSGNLPDKLVEVLQQFKTFGVCTSDMRRLIWRIFKQSDNNLYKSFSMALEGLTKETDVEEQVDRLEFIGQQVIFPERAIDLQSKFGFYEKLLKAVENDSMHPKIRIGAAEIIEDYLPNQPGGLTPEWLDIYVKLYKRCDSCGSGLSGFSGDDEVKLKRALMRSILRTIDMQGKSDQEVLPLHDLCDLLISTAIMGTDLHLEALIILTLGNLVNRKSSIRIPNAERLAYKLMRMDTVNDGVVIIDDEVEEAVGTGGQGMPKPTCEGVVYISKVVANILLASIKLHKLEKRVLANGYDYFDFLIRAMEKNPCKMTRILAAECLFEVSSEQVIPSPTLLKRLSEFTMDPVLDVQIYCSAAFCTNICANRGQIIDTDSLNLLAKLYIFDTSALLLDGKDFTKYVNEQILLIFESQAPKVGFSNEIYQVLTCVLSNALARNQDSFVSRILNVITDSVHTGIKRDDPDENITYRQVILPQFCLQVVEEVYLCVPVLYVAAGQVLLYASNRQGYTLSEAAVQIAHFTFVSELNKDSRERVLSFHLLLTSARNQGLLAENIWQDVETELISERLDALFTQTAIKYEETSKKGELSTHFVYNLAAKTVNTVTEMQKCFQEMELVKASFADIPTKASITELKSWIFLALESLLEYQHQGRRLSTFTFSVLESILSSRVWFVEFLKCLECLLKAADNNQSISAPLVSAVTAHFHEDLGGKTVKESSKEHGEQDEKNKNLCILKLASTLVGNNQILPVEFVASLVDRFSKCTAQGYLIGESEEYDAILFILVRLAQNPTSPLPKYENVAKHLCNLWSNSFKNTKKQMGVLNKWTTMIPSKTPHVEINKDDEDEIKKIKAKDFLRRFCLFWKKSRSLRHRLSIISGLRGIINAHFSRHFQKSNNDKSELFEWMRMIVSTVYCPAIQQKNIQIVSSALGAFLELNNAIGVQFCSEQEFYVLLGKQNDPALSSMIKKLVIDFLDQHKDRLPQSVKEELQLVENLEGLSDEKCLDSLDCILERKDVAQCKSMVAVKSGQLRQWLEGFLQKTHKEPYLLNRAIHLISKYFVSMNLNMSTVETIGFVMITADNENRNLCWKILDHLLSQPSTLKFLNSPTLVLYLKSAIEKPGSSMENTRILLGILESMAPEDQSAITFNDTSIQVLKTKLCFEQFLVTLESKNEFGFDEIIQWTMTNPISCMQLNLTATLRFLKLLKRMKYLNFGQTPSSIVYLIAKSIQQVAEDNYLEEITQDYLVISKVIQILEGYIQNTQNIVVSSNLHIDFQVVLHAYSTLISHGSMYTKNFKNISSLTSTLRILGNWLSNDQPQTMIIASVWECIVQATCLCPLIQTPFFPSSILIIMAESIHSPNPKIRRLVVQAYYHLDMKCVLPEDSSQPARKVSMPDIGALVVQVFRDILGKDVSSEKIKHEIQQDWNWTINFVSLLYSLRHWDLQALCSLKEQRPLWRRALINSDFIATIASKASQDEQLKLAVALNHLWEIHGEKVEELISLLAERLDEISELRKYDIEVVLNLSQILSTVPLKEGMKILRGSLNKDLDQQSKLVEEIGLANMTKCLEDKLPANIASGSREITHILSCKIMEAVGPSLAQNLVSSISKIDKYEDLNCLVQLLAKAKCQFEIGAGKKRNGTLMKNILRPPKSPKKLPRLIQLIRMRLLISQIPSELLIRSHGVDGYSDHRLENSILCLLEQGIPMSQLEKFIQLSIKRCEGMPRNFTRIVYHTLSQVVQYRLNQQIFGHVIAALTNSDFIWTPSDCFDTMNRLVNNHVFVDGSGGSDGGGANQGALKPIESLIEELCNTNETMRSMNSGQRKELQELILRISEGKEPSKIFGVSQAWEGTIICEWNAEHIQTWATKAKSVCAKAKSVCANQVDSQNSKLFLMEALMIAKQAFLLTTNFRMTHVQLLACYFGLGLGYGSASSPFKGQLLQVATGSGKSAIISVIAVIKSLQGNRVDVYTSSSVLAERDSKEWAKFYSLFGLECSHNGDKGSSYISGLKPCYTKDIVYGECAQFQFDYLRHSYSGLGTRGKRDFGWAVIDEVDAMFIDDSSKLARLSSPLPGMDLLQLIYHLLWHRLGFIQSHTFSMFDQLYYLEGQLNSTNLQYSFADPETQELKTVANLAEFILGGGNLAAARIQQIDPLKLESFVTKHLSAYALELVVGNEISGTKPQVKLPQNLQKFAESQIQNWVSSAMTAVTYKENVHYIVHGGQVKPVDFATTGIVQGSTNWNNGLHQFLQLKHGLRLGSESVTTNFLSNLAIFQKYGSDMVGFTGTLGSAASHTVLDKVYNVHMLVIPEAHTKRYVRFPDLVTGAVEYEWLCAIIITTLEEISKHRGVLIICETIKEAEKIGEALSRFRMEGSSTPVKVKLYTKNEQNQEQHIERIHKGDVIVATNLAGRGTDIKTAEIEAYGGLHVILTFLPPSLRVENQAFGRTSRQGKVGTGQLILRTTAAVTGPKISVKELVVERDRLEREALLTFEKEQLPMIQTKDKLFEQFSKCLGCIRQEIRNMQPLQMVKNLVGWVAPTKYVKNLVGWVAPTKYEVTILQAVEERWAMFLRKIDDGRIKETEAKAKYIEFEEQVMMDLTGSSGFNLIRGGHNPFYFVQLGNHKYLQDSKLSSSLAKAVEYFDAAIDLDSHFAIGAYVGKAYALLKGQVNIIRWDKHEAGYKLSALELLIKAMGLLQGEMATLKVQQMLVQRTASNKLSPTGGMECPLFHQLIEKTNLLGSYIKTIETLIAVVEKSLRRVHCTTITKDQDEMTTHFLETRLPNGSRQIAKPRDMSDSSYHLTFHNLTSFTDGGITRDQAIDTLEFKNVKRRMKESFLSLWSGSEHEENFTIGLSCPNVDVGEIGTELAKTKISVVGDKEQRVNMELISLPLDRETMKLDLKALNEGLRPKSYSMEIMVGLNLPVMDKSENCEGSLICWDELWTLLTCKDLLGCAIKVSVILAKPKIHDGIEVLKLSETFHNVSLQQLKKFQTQFSGDLLESIKCIHLKSSAVMEVMRMRFLKLQPPQNPWTFNLTLECLEGKLENWSHLSKSYLQNIQNGIRLHFENLTEKDAQNIIPVLRSKHVEFHLHCQQMNFDTAEFILGKANMKQEDILQSEVKELLNLFMSDCLPLAEILELSARGISLLATFNEKKFVPWISIASVVGLATLQAAAGGALICTGFGATLGMGLITEGMADLVAAQRIYATREFSWSSYGTQKAVSLAISAWTMGLSSLKDGAKGIAMILEGGATEVVEQAATKVLSNGQLLSTTIAISGKNLKSLAYKQIITSTVETGARIVLKEAANCVADFAFEQVKGDIIQKIGDHISTKFRSTEMCTLLRYHWAIDKARLQLQIKAIVEGTVNPKATGWLQLWNSVGAPLCNGILSSPQFLGSSYSRAIMISGMVMGSREIIIVIDRLCQEIHSKLQKIKPSWAQILQSLCGISEETAELIALQMKKVKNKKQTEQNEFDLEKIAQNNANIPKVDYQRAEECFETLKKSWSQFRFDDNVELSQTMKQIVDTVANHIIRTANSHLVSPIMSSCVGSVVAKISAELQDRFLTSADESSDEQKQTKANEGDLTDEGAKCVQGNNVKTTFQSQIMGNAKAYTVAYQKRQIVVQAIQMKAKANAEGIERDAGSSDSTANKNQLPDVVDIVVNKDPADMSIIFSVATANDLDVKIVDDPDYVPTEAEIVAGTKIILYEKGSDGGIGHYSLKGPDGQLVNIKGSDGMDCGYAVLAHLTNKSVDEMRLEAADLIQNNPNQFSEIKDASDRIRERYPLDANHMLGVGGKEKPVEWSGDNKGELEDSKRRKSSRDDHDPKYEDIKKKCDELLKKSKVEERLDKLTVSEKIGDGKGFVYLIRVEGENDHIKVGLAGDVEKRIKQMQRNNNEKYEQLGKVPTPYRYSTEAVVHRMLSGYSDPRKGVDGGTEYFRGDWRLFFHAVETAKDELVRLHGIYYSSHGPYGIDFTFYRSEYLKKRGDRA